MNWGADGGAGLATNRGPVICFDDFRLDVPGRLLTRVSDGEALQLASRALDALILLASQPGVLVSKAELIAALWPSVTVEANSLAKCISSLRKALGGGPDRGFILTEPGRGYRFMGAIHSADVGSAKQASLVGRTSANPHAFQLYVSGWFAITRHGGSNLTNALDRFERAAQLDPDFALAHICVSEAYALLGVFELARPHDVFPKARAALHRALAINPDLAEGQAARAHIQFAYELDFAGAERSIQRALAIDDRCVMALHYAGLVMIILGRFDEAQVYLRRAQAEEPLAANINANIAMAHYFAGHYHEAAAQAEAALELDPAFSHARSVLGRSLLRLGQFDRAIEEFGRRRIGTLGAAADIPVALALSGRQVEARAELIQLRTSNDYVSFYNIAAIHAALGDADDALDWLERARDERMQYISYVARDPAFASVRSTPRFKTLLEVMGLV